MLRRNQPTRTTATNHDMTQAKRLEVGKTESATVRRLKKSDVENRSQSARQRSRGQEDHDDLDRQLTTARTRSVSPPVHSPRPTPEQLLKKYNNIYAKIVAQLKTVKNLTESKSNETENILDLRRQLQRADEFSIRFSRNNLYDTKRILNDIKTLMSTYALDNLSTAEGTTLSKKIILAYQTASQSLQIYINYVKNPANLEVPDKINELILLIAEMFLCCEELSLSSTDANDAVKVCNELLTLLKSKPPVAEYLDIKQESLSRKKSKEVNDVVKTRNLSMYKAKSGTKCKTETGQKKKPGTAGVLAGAGQRKMTKKEEKRAKITHEIYTQKMNPKQTKTLGSKNVKFEQGNARDADKSGKEQTTDKKPPKKSRFFTPREVRSQDDDVETMVQTIDDDELTLKIDPSPCESDDNGSNLNRASFRELLLEAIEDLQGTNKTEQKATLRKLLTSIQNCFKEKSHSDRPPPSVRVYHFKHKDSDEEQDKVQLGRDEPEVKEEEPGRQPRETEPNSGRSLKTLQDRNKAKDEILARERRLNVVFKPIKQRSNEDQKQPEVVPRGKIRLKLDNETMASVGGYRKMFLDFTKHNVMYMKQNATRPWELVEKVADRIILDTIGDVTEDFENDAILKRLYMNELLEIVN